MSLQSLFYPRAAVVVGSMGEGKLGNILAGQMVKGGFSPIYAVNPKGEGIPGVPGFPSVSAIGAVVDLAVVASPAPTVVDVLEDCGKAGVTAAVIITSGFAEAGNKAGEQVVLETARRNNIRFVGPNCAGIFNTGHNLFPTLETLPPTGRTALLSQSGAFGGAILAWAERQGLGFSKFVSYGNRADLDEVELLDYLGEDDETDVVAFYIESLANGRRFLEAARRFTRRKPLVIIKAGRTQTGSRATLSHTGSMAGSDAVYDAAFRQAGAVRVANVEEMFDLCKGFTSFPPVGGRRMCIVTNSGGPGVLAADHAEQLGMQLPEPSPETRAALAEFLPAHCALRNPIDLTVEGTGEDYRRVLEIMLREYDSAVAINVNTPYMPSLPQAQGIRAAARSSGKAVAINFMADKTIADSLPFLQAENAPNFVTGERAVSVLAFLAAYEEGRQRGVAGPLEPPAPDAEQPKAPLLEPEAMALLGRNGIPVPPFEFCTSRDAALAGCARLGYPVAMKVVSPQIIHKSDVGGVVLNIRDEVAAAEAWQHMEGVARGLDFRGVVIYPMLKAEHEVLLGLSRDPQFGPVVVFGLGGIFTEVLHDISLRVAPVDEEEALRMIQGIRGFALLQGARGRKPADLPALAQAIARLSRLPFLYPAIQEVDLNPVFLLEKGLVVGDVRILFTHEEDK